MNTLNARYGHTNLVARDWRSLAAFYEEHFGCVPVPPERDYRGPDLEAGTGVPGAALQGAHLRLPGHGPNGPTLEIYQYQPELEGLPPVVNRPGFGHIAFVVDDVPQARETVLAAARSRGGRGGDAADQRRPARHLVLRHRPGGQHRRAPGLVGVLAACPVASRCPRYAGQEYKGAGSGPSASPHAYPAWRDADGGWKRAIGAVVRQMRVSVVRRARRVGVESVVLNA